MLQLKALEVSEAGGAVKLKSSTEKIDVTKWIFSVLLEGMRVGASDAHFEPGPVGLTTRFRIDGVLREYGKKLESEYVAQMVNRIKIMSNMDNSSRKHRVSN